MMQREMTFDDYLGMLRRRWVTIVIFGVVGTVGAYLVSRFLPNQFTSQSTVLVEEPTVPATLVNPVATTNLVQNLTLMRPDIVNRERLEPLIRQNNLFPDRIDHVPTATLVAELSQHIEVPLMRSPNEDSPPPGFNVRVTTNDPHTAQVICAAVTNMFIDENARRRAGVLGATTEFFDQEINAAKSQLDQQDAKLATFQAVHPGASPDDDQTNLSLMGTLGSELSAVTGDLSRVQQDKTLTESILNQQIASRQASQTGKNPETLEQQLAAKQTELTNLQSRYTDDYPDVIKVKGEIAVLQKKVVDAEASNVEENDKARTSEPVEFIRLRAQIAADKKTIDQDTKQQEHLQGQIADVQNRIRQTPAVQEEYKQLTRDHQTALDIYNSLLKRKSDAEIAKNVDSRQEGEKFDQLGNATLPTEPSSPNRPLFALGGLGGGLAVGFGLALLFEMRDTSLRTERDVETQLRLPVMAVIPSIDLLATNKSLGQSIRPMSEAGLGVGART